MFYHPEFALPVPIRKNLCELYNDSTIKLAGTKYPVLAYAELNDPQQVIPLTEVLGRFSVADAHRYICLGNRRFQYDGQWFDSPYCDLFFRSWSRAVEMFNDLIQYKRSPYLEEMQLELQQISRAFDEAFHGLLGVGFAWHVDLTQPICKESLPSCSEIYGGCNIIPFFSASRPAYNGGAVYALLSMLVLEIRFQEMEKRVRELLLSDTQYDHIVALGPEIEQMRDAIRKAPSTEMVLHPLNPMRHYVTSFDLFVDHRYNLEYRESLIWIQGVLALAKTATVADVETKRLVELMRSIVQTLTCVVSDQSVLEFVYKTGQMYQPVPIARRERQRFSSVANSCGDQGRVSEDDLPSVTAINAMRATCLRVLGCNVDWNSVEVMPLPDDWVPSHVVELDESNEGDACDESTEHCSFAKTLIRLFCIYR